MKYSIRFLRQGSVDIEVDEQLTKEQLIEVATQKLESMSDNEIIEAMSDFVNPEINGYFDSAPLVDAIEDSDNDFDIVYSSFAWKAYAGV